ncbi:hypothetical protein B4U79_06104 [Dinothrombium tinctorium]|uniref:Uncharacterized protein n=1 Tax=Dinothrombium tinctorium TaxID=1965070 RepID=A0A3S3Q9R6_9ACAR|nr:hypothetical protein B4U79_15391 [Dinothrombium tinctorium]RWS06175.1 hypothetical protein B4U79_06104 [Dinothrombium tinctorium]
MRYLINLAHWKSILVIVLKALLDSILRDLTEMASTLPQNQNVVIVVDPSQQEQPFGIGFENTNIRNNFVKKVYGILSVQIFATALIGLTLYTKLLAMIPLLVLACFPRTGRTVPLNYFLLGVFVRKIIFFFGNFNAEDALNQTLLEGFTVGTISCIYRTEIVLIAIAATAISVLIISLLAASSLFDVTNCGSVLIVMSIVYIVVGFIAFFIIMIFKIDIKTVHLVFSLFGAFLFSLWLAYDTQLILGGKRRELSPEDYIYGAIALYIDIIQIFLNILQIVNSLSNNES